MTDSKDHQHEVAEQIRQLDEWFRFAETIAQTRLYNFLMAATILFIACATVLPSNEMRAHVFAMALSFLGVVLSAMWYFLGRRQGKFHGKIEYEINKILDRTSDRRRFAIFHVNDMKRCPEKQYPDFRLTSVELYFSNRCILWLVPLLLGAAFLFTLSIAIYQVARQLCT